MTRGFDQQDSSALNVLRTAPSPQHGQKSNPQKSDAKTGKPKAPRSFEPRPGH